MAVEEYRKAKLATADMELDTAGHGNSTPGTYTRELSSGLTSGPLDKFTADAVPHRDEAFISGAGQPFARVTPASSRNTEVLVRDLRINVRDMQNFEGLGGVAGSGVSSTIAARNTEVWDYALSLVAAGAVNGIFFPGRYYEFMEWAGTPQHGPNAGLYASHILPMAGISGLKIAGAGIGATTLAANGNANKSYNLFYVPEIGNISFEDMSLALDPTATNGACIRVLSAVTPADGFTFRNLSIANGVSGGIRMVSGGTGALSNAWIENCTFLDGTGHGAFIDGVRECYVNDNVFSGTNQGLIFNTSAPALTNIVCRSNKFTGSSMELRVNRGGTYSSSIHKDITIDDNQISNGDIMIDGFNEWSVTNNQLYNGGISATFAGMTSAHNLAILNNFIDGGSAYGHGIYMLGNGVTISGFEIAGGRIHNAPKSGVYLSVDNGQWKFGKIRDMTVLNCSREDAPSATDYSGIHLREASNAGGFRGCHVHDNTCWTTNATAPSGNKQLYGIETSGTGAGLSNYNLIHDNHVAGWTAAAFSTFLGATTAANAHDNHDYGTAPIA